jgi:hypothetical protein
MDAHSREKNMSLRDRAQRESFASETLCYIGRSPAARRNEVKSSCRTAWEKAAGK